MFVGYEFNHFSRALSRHCCDNGAMITILIVGLVIGVCGFIYIESPYYDHGGDGLGGWLELVSFALLALGCGVGLLVSKIGFFSYFPFLGEHAGSAMLGTALTPLILFGFWMGYIALRQNRAIAEDKRVWETTSSLLTFTSEKFGVTFPYVNKLRTGNNLVEAQETEHEVVIKTPGEGELYARITSFTNPSNTPTEQFLNEFVKKISEKVEVKKQDVHLFSKISDSLPVYKLVSGVEEFKDGGPLFPKMYFHRNSGVLNYAYEPPAPIYSFSIGEDPYKVYGTLVDYTSNVYFIEVKPNTFLAIALAEYSSPYGILSDDQYDTQNTAKWYRFMTLTE